MLSCPSEPSETKPLDLVRSNVSTFQRTELTIWTAEDHRLTRPMVMITGDRAGAPRLEPEADVITQWRALIQAH
jgi:hypothetical protein